MLVAFRDDLVIAAVQEQVEAAVLVAGFAGGAELARHAVDHPHRRARAARRAHRVAPEALDAEDRHLAAGGRHLGAAQMRRCALVADVADAAGAIGGAVGAAGRRRSRRRRRRGDRRGSGRRERSGGPGPGGEPRAPRDGGEGQRRAQGRDEDGGAEQTQAAASVCLAGGAPTA